MDILELNQKNLIKGHIYKITNLKTSKIYIGQTRSHRLNKNKYRKFGFNGRFKDHISEAINNTKKNQCTYLNNSIRQYGKENFTVELLEECSISELNNKEIYYIKKLCSLYPKGYNLSIGGKTFSKSNLKNNSELNEFKKRGRPFGYKHKKETIEKFKIINKITAEKRTEPINNTNLIQYYDDKKIQKLLEFPILLKKPINEIIKPIINKNNGLIHDWNIRYKDLRLKVCSKNMDLNEKYSKLKNIVLKAKKIISKGKNC